MLTTALKSSVIAAAALAIDNVPDLPPAYSMVLKWNTPAGYEYIHQLAYDKTANKLSDNAIVNNSVATRTLEDPSGTGYSYIYNTKRKTCVETDIKGETVGAGVRTFPDMKNASTEVVNGVLCDKWTKDLGSCEYSPHPTCVNGTAAQ